MGLSVLTYAYVGYQDTYMVCINNCVSKKSHDGPSEER